MEINLGTTIIKNFWTYCRIRDSTKCYFFTRLYNRYRATFNRINLCSFIVMSRCIDTYILNID